jgi:two-component system chemotaxis response regulator CheY
MKVLTVDDALTVRTMVKNILESEGKYSVYEAENGVKALEMVRAENNFDVILLDWEMPEMDGLTFLTEVREKHMVPNTKINMLTSLNKMANILKAMDAGADEYIMKPFTPEIVLEKIQSIVEK